jgi:hypothetical protein
MNELYDEILAKAHELNKTFAAEYLKFQTERNEVSGRSHIDKTDFFISWAITRIAILDVTQNRSINLLKEIAGKMAIK